TMYQITEPLSDTPSTLFGTDVNGAPLNVPLQDTVIDPVTGDNLITTGAEGKPALLDKFTVTKPSISLVTTLSAPPAAAAGGALVYTVQVTSTSAYALNGAQIVVTLPDGVAFAGSQSNTLAVQGQDVVVSLGRLAKGATKVIQVKGRVGSGVPAATVLI